MPYGRSYRKKAKKAFRKYATRRMGKRIAGKLIGRAIPVYGQIQTVRDVTMAGRYVYRHLKSRQVKLTDEGRDFDVESLDHVNHSRGRRKRRYGIDDFY